LPTACSELVDFSVNLHSMMSAQTQELTEVLSETGIASPSSLIVWNDDVNTFDWVIETLMEICDHSREQAEQCAWFIHTKGKYAVKNGSADILKPMCEAIVERGINATIENVPV
jgi:ATP-dependent Clp protease adaptor protein ClpS